MPRRSYRGTAGLVFHVLNRGNLKQTLFWTPADYEAFIEVLREGLARYGVGLLAYSIMPNHWHLILWSRRDGDVGRFVWWVTLTHACRWQRVHGELGAGPVYQGPYGAILIQNDAHLLVACAYAERNAVRARLVADAGEWRWGSACDPDDPAALPLTPWPVPRPSDWVARINRPEPPADLEMIRQCVHRNEAFGTDEWRATNVTPVGWRGSAPAIGRPRTKTTPGVVMA